MERVECVVVGAGVIGLAVARILARQGREVVVLEAERAIGAGTSSRNSEVIHAGLYYPTGSLKARLCVTGRRALYDFIETHGVGHARPGKLIVATDESQLARLGAIAKQAAANGVNDLETLSAAEARRLEPSLSCVGGVLSPSTGIVDSHGLMLALRGDAEAAGAVVALNSPLLGAEVGDDGLFRLEVGGAEPMRLATAALVNAAGLGAWAVARATRGLAPTAVPPAWLAKGSYFALAGGRAPFGRPFSRPFSRLIYPVPEVGGLGVHLTLDLGGQARFGPDVEWVERVDYAVDPARAAGFYAAIRRYWPGLADGALVPAYAGVRPKLSGPAEPAADFVLSGPAAHGIAGLVNLFGIESPGLTACLAIADEVALALAPAPVPATGAS